MMIIDIKKIHIILMLVSTAIYILFVLGVGLLYYDKLRRSYTKFIMKKRLKARRRALKPENRLENHLRNVMVSLKKPIEPKQFILATMFLFLFIVFVGLQTVPLISAIWMGILISFMPYLFLRVRLETVRRKGSYEGERLVSEFLTQYRICGCNIYRTIEKVILSTEDMKVSCKLLFKLLLELRSTGNTRLIRESTERFAYGIHTNWSRMLANNIRIAAESGMNVTLALEDLLIQLRDARIIAEERKRLNSESARIVVFLVPFMYIGTAFLSVNYIGMSMSGFLKNQFYTEQGFLLMLMIIFLFLANLTFIEIVTNQRFDY
ncbi:hypothetical protein [Sinanaerobacter chloroacetimidivorans]|uniref:Type II secretion system protein GspF domain-containing protein n=1 Tax=Sinanaerobacter chloroacetimidivorans TaxID=2818044 RepID=A0A8J8AZS2_9FIRM|nr:hypothetical protein [Sinanaerobacter chloroacetimidivorans]MBR0596828.1 hypothetical protein [Sinanaerobacter chloroacetimidivorans]